MAIFNRSLPIVCLIIMMAVCVYPGGDTITVVTYSHKYENVAYKIDGLNHQLILIGDGETVIAPDEIRFVFDQSENDITDKIMNSISQPILCSEPQLKEKASIFKSSKSGSNKPLFKNIKTGFGIGYSHSFSDYFNKKIGVIMIR